MLVHHRVNPSITFTGTHLYTWVERGPVRVKVFCLGTEHKVPNLGLQVNRDRSLQSLGHLNHGATALLTNDIRRTLYNYIINMILLNEPNDVFEVHTI